MQCERGMDPVSSVAGGTSRPTATQITPLRLSQCLRSLIFYCLTDLHASLCGVAQSIYMAV